MPLPKAGILEVSNAGEVLGTYQALEGVRLNLVSNAQGALVGTSGTSADLSNQIDRKLLVELRRLSDAIVTSGATARAEMLNASKHAPMFVLTKGSSVDGLEQLLGGSGLPDSDRHKVTLITDSASRPAVLAALVQAGLKSELLVLNDLNAETVLRKLNNLGFSKILVEFGATLCGVWSRAGLIDEVCLTVTGEQLDPILPSFVSGDFTLAKSLFVRAEKTAFFRFRRNL